MPGKFMILKNAGRAPRSFRLPLREGKAHQRLRDSMMVVIPGCNPDSGEPGISDPIPKELLESNSKKEFLVQLFEEGVITAEAVT